VMPYTPASWFAQKQDDPAFRTKLAIAVALVKEAVAWHWPFKAVVADSFYGEDRTVRANLREMNLGYVFALKPSHSWRCTENEPGSLDEVARATVWHARHPGVWQAVDRVFREGHRERWWALEVQAGPYGPQRRERAVVVTTDPQTLPELSTWYLVTNLPIPNTPSAPHGPGSGASLAEVVRLYGLRMWVEQSYKQVKITLGWAEDQVRSSRAIQRHWILIYCAFTFCWWQVNPSALPEGWLGDAAMAPAAPPTTPVALRGEKKLHRRISQSSTLVAQRAQTSSQLARTRHYAQALLARLFVGAPAASLARVP